MHAAKLGPDPATTTRSLVTTDWLADHLGAPGLVVLEVDEHPEVYEIAHVPGARRVSWSRDLVDPVRRDLADNEQLGDVLGRLGVRPDSTIVLYGDQSNWWATYAFWLFQLFGIADVRLFDGGRDLWLAEGRPVESGIEPIPLGTSPLPLPRRDDTSYRIFREEVATFSAFAEGPLLDVRSPGEYAGEVTRLPGYPGEVALRAGHIPGAVNVPWRAAVGRDGRFRPLGELQELYDDAGATGTEPIVTYCRIGERSSHTWFALTQILGIERVRNYDGSWTEWGNLVGAAIER